MSRKKQIIISVCIVNFNTSSLLEKCLSSILKNSPGINIEVVVVDNASVDGSVNLVKKKFPEVRLIVNKKNLYFSKACNQALRISSGEYVLILNTDCEIKSNDLAKIISYLKKNPSVGAVSVRHVDEKDKVDATCSTSPSPVTEIFESNVLAKPFVNSKLVKKILTRHRYASWKRNSVRQVDILPGSLMLIPAKVLKKVGLLDENLKLFYSDTDLCIRIKEAGFKLFHLGNIKATHLRAQTVKILKPWERYRLSETDMLTFYKKHYGSICWTLLWILYRPNWLYWRLKTLNET